MGKTTNLKNVLLISVFLVATTCSIAAGKIIYVDDDASPGGNGHSWGTAYRYLQDALTAALSGDEIRVAEGIYKPDRGGGNTPGNRTATFQLKNGVVIKGGYAGFGEPNADARDIEVYETVLSGDLAGNDEPNFVNYEENSYHVVTGSFCDETTVLDGFTITAGYANGSNQYDRGGGMFNHSGNPIVTNCIFSVNSATEWGGGMYNRDNSATVKVCSFSGNLSGKGGGGVYNYHSSSTVENCTFSGNRADWHGGGIYNFYHSSPNVKGCTFSSNSAEYDGGGMANYRSVPKVTNCTFTANSGKKGGGMSNNRYSRPTVERCTFTANSAEGGGGGMFNNYRSGPTVTNCTFIGNMATHVGGGIAVTWYCSPTLVNCTFSGNSSPNGNALGCDSDKDPSSLQLSNCILWDGGDEIWNDDGSTITITYSDVQGGWPGNGNINADPCFFSLPCWDEKGDWFDGCYHLLFDSPCIDSGDPNYIAEPNETDLDGNPRVIGGRIDMGAYEFNQNPIADAGPDQTVEAQAPWGATVTLDGSGSSDADSTPGTIDDINDLNWYEIDPCDPNFDVLLGSGRILDCNLSIGEHIIVLEVIDRAGASDSNEITIIVQDTTPPDINCPPDMTLECPADTTPSATGKATATDTCGNVTITHSDQWQSGCGNTGTLARTWTATDGSGNSSTCVQIITVVDTTPPEFILSVAPTMLWPPDHKMYEITPSWTVSDECDATPDVSLVSIIANEGDDTIGDGHTSNDIQIHEDGSIYLRSERSGTNNDRVYTIIYQAVDDCGNTAVRSATVSIPHDFKVLAKIAARWLWAGPGRIPEDLNGDGIVNLADFAKFAENWIR